MGRDSSVGIATRCGLGGPWSNPGGGGGEVFRTRLDRPCDPTSLLYNGYRVSFLGLKRPGRGVDHPLPYSSEVKEIAELYPYSTSGLSWPVIGWILPLPLPSLAWCDAGCITKESAFYSRQRQEIILFVAVHRSVVWPSRSLVKWQRRLSVRNKFGQVVKLTAHLYLLPMWRMSGAISPLLRIWLMFIRVKDGFPSALTVVSLSCRTNFS